MNDLDESHGYDPNSGITIPQLEQFTQLVLSDKHTLNNFIFDWDRTLTMFEGLYAISPTVQDMLNEIGLSNISVSDVGYYYFGGIERVRQLQKLWKALTSKGIDIWVLSSNPAVGKLPQFFLDLLDSLYLPLPNDRLIYRGPLTKYQYIKQFIEKK